MAFVNNFSTSFRWCDFLFKTDLKYREYRARLDAAKKAGLSQEEYEKMERQLTLEAERAGVEAEKVAEATAFWAEKTKVQ